MCCERPGQRALKIIPANRFQLIRELNRSAAGLNHCPGFARKGTHVGIRAALRVIQFGPAMSG